ncbi:hypothetical protein HanOQP8_Chr11g0417721 [Helianthus annuus]|nr:hypothetical protein HanHA89_Chr11g0439011 [Helianthus annuus]KAJ0686614.1 hypothetical protein HanLR1_Chr11g0416721 [Helianthus annuus]KAJ0690428.1 hypothetical protein HanOQP8_Chr11g0417721 [Helianthus annuus]
MKGPVAEHHQSQFETLICNLSRYSQKRVSTQLCGEHDELHGRKITVASMVETINFYHEALRILPRQELTIKQ